MEHLELSLACPGDFDRVAAFYRNAIAHTPQMADYGRWVYGLHPTDELIWGYIQSGAMYLWEEKREILCALALTPDQGSDYHDVPWAASLRDDEAAVVHLLCVNPRHQRQGIGRRAVEQAVEQARQMGKKALRLDALACNTPAHRLYESLDFLRRGTAHWFADNVRWTDFYLYERIL